MVTFAQQLDRISRGRPGAQSNEHAWFDQLHRGGGGGLFKFIGHHQPRTVRNTRSQLPEHTRERKLVGYEHIDVLWGKDIHKDVLPIVLGTLQEFKEADQETSHRQHRSKAATASADGTVVDADEKSL